MGQHLLYNDIAMDQQQSKVPYCAWIIVIPLEGVL